MNRIFKIALVFSFFFLNSCSQKNISNISSVENSELNSSISISIDIKSGTFYELEDLLSILDEVDVMNICYRNNWNNLFDYNFETGERTSISVDLEKIVDVEKLDERIANQIVIDYWEKIKNDEYVINENITIDEIKISRYFGCYKGYYALIFDEYHHILPAVIQYELIGNYVFVRPYRNGNRVILWKMD